ncbi:MAG: ribosomal protein [Rickettsiaceae bacterium]|jgi:small subunit ribosomal protein S7|nr:ribosomal protein [Rickettsiaceae bacterium]
MRRRAAPKRKIIPDAKFGEIIITKLVNRLMEDGKKSVVERSVYDAFSLVEKKMKKNPLEIFRLVLDNVTPRLEVRSRRIGGATYQIPVEVSDRRGTALALKWLKTAIQKSSGRNLAEKIVFAFGEAAENKGWAVKKREEVFKMAEANKAFAHYRW